MCSNLFDKTRSAYLKAAEWSRREEEFVKRAGFAIAVNWALRNIGKRNLAMNSKAIALADELRQSQDRTARWVGSDAYRELTSEKVLARLVAKKRTVPATGQK